MELDWIYFVCMIMCFDVDQSYGQYGIPSSPCPQMFQYQRVGYEWMGLAHVHSLPLGQTMKFEVILSLRAKLTPAVTFLHPSNPSIHMQYLGAVELYGSREDAIQEIRLNRLVRYRIRFASQSPLPKLVQISVNGEVLCTGLSETGAYVTLIKLEHTLFTEAAAGHHLSDFHNQINAQDPFVIYNNDDGNYDSRATTPERPQNEYPIQSLQPPPEVSTYQQTSHTLQHECGTPHVKNNFKNLVVGGETVKRGAWPWLVAVYVAEASSQTFNCGGNLISPRTIVTAAHCFRTSKRTLQPHEIVIYLGRHNILNRKEAGVKAAQVKQIVIHSDYLSKDTSYDADIALVIMRERVKYTEFIRPICLWNGSDNLSSLDGQMGTVIGWGKDGEGNILSPEPKKINIPVVSEAECLRSSDTYRYITSQRTFCAGDRDGRGPCNGDSGGGMTFNINNTWILRGIVSAALADPILNTCNLGEYVVFTDVAKFISWIKSYML